MIKDARSRQFRQWTCALLCLVIFGAVPQPAWSYTQCQGDVEKIWAGDGGMLWIHLTNGGSAVIQANDPNKIAVLSLATTALAAHRQVILRYAGEGVNCASVGRSDFVGMYML